VSSSPQPTSHPPVDIDYAGLFAATPSPYLILTPDFVICDVNAAYLRATRRTREDLVGRNVFDAFPDNPDDPSADGVRNLRASLERALATGRADSMAIQKYDIPVTDEAGRTRFEERFWSPVNAPVLDRRGKPILLIHRVEDVTSFVRVMAAREEATAEPPLGDEPLQAELFVRGLELQAVNQRLREAHAHEHQVALELQKAMLPSVAGDLAHGRTAVRYRPAVGSMNVCGDWYDVSDLGDERFGVAVGDVVGHGFVAAGVMGQLRAALAAATRATGRADRALEVLDAYAGSFDSAVGTTVVKVVVDLRERTLSYSVAGHPPPVLVRASGALELLDEATGPPLAAMSEPTARPLARTAFEPGDVLALYTDGLVERRRESIADGIDRLAASVRRHAGLGIEDAADAVLADLSTAEASTDDIALLLVTS